MIAREAAAAARRGVGLFRSLERGVIAVSGADATRWLDGMVSNDVARLQAGSSHSGCYATLLTPQGRIIADLQVLLRSEGFWLDVSAEAVSAVMTRLGRYIIADAVELADRSGDFERMGLEGPRSYELLSRVAAQAPRLAPDACAAVLVGGEPVVVAAFGWSGEAAVQLFTPVASAAAVVAELRRAGDSLGLVDCDGEALEILRIEAGIPRLGAELDESVLPAEARLERAVASGKGCYTGQEVIERLRSRGQVSHLLVGLQTSGDSPLEVGAAVTAEGKRVGEVTSSCLSGSSGAIALAFVRRPFADPGVQLSVGSRPARVVVPPFAEREAPT